MYRPAELFAFLSPTTPGEDPCRPTAIDFVVTGQFNTTNAEGPRASRNSSSSSGAITAAGEAKKEEIYRLKVHATWKRAFPGVPCPGPAPDALLPPGGLD